MMKNILFFLGSLALAIVTAVLVHLWLSNYDSPGYVLMGFGHWSLEMTFVVFAVTEVLVFFALYVLFRLLGYLLRLPAQIKASSQTLRFNRSQEALIAGLIDSAAGNWEKAEKVLIRHASGSGAPLLHYLTAARAAQSRGALEKRDEYLRKASEQVEGADIAVGLTQAELHLSEKQFEQAIETLTNLNSIDPTHASVLKLLHQAYQHVGDWQGVRTLLPSLHKNKVLMEVEVKLLETETFSRLLKQAAQSGNASEIQTLWESVPEHIQKLPDVEMIYFAAMIQVGASAGVEAEIVKALSRNWHETLVVIYGNLDSENPINQLLAAERWIAAHPNNAVLLRVLGKISFKCDQVDKAQDYLTRSINIEPSVAAYQLLGDLFFDRNEKDKACECYKYGLELASSNVVSNAEQILE